MDKYDQLAKEALEWFSLWVRPLGDKATPEQLEEVRKDIARVFRNGFEGKSHPTDREEKIA